MHEYFKCSKMRKILQMQTVGLMLWVWLCCVVSQLTSSVALAEVRESPDVPQPHTEAHAGQHVLGFVVPLRPLSSLLHLQLLQLGVRRDPILQTRVRELQLQLHVCCVGFVHREGWEEMEWWLEMSINTDSNMHMLTFSTDISSHIHTLSLSLSLSHTHTHTHTDTDTHTQREKYCVSMTH